MDKIYKKKYSTYVLKERLANRKEWATYFSEVLLHKDITEQVSKEFYKNRPLLSFVFKLYFLPINFLNYLSKLRTWHYYKKCEKEIEILKNEIGQNIKNEIK